MGATAGVDARRVRVIRSEDANEQMPRNLSWSVEKLE
jgi:hypothetical protein